MSVWTDIFILAVRLYSRYSNHLANVTMIAEVHDSTGHKWPIQKSISEYAVPVLSIPEPQIRDRSDLFEILNEKETDLQKLLRRIKYGSYDLSDPLLYPAKEGLHFNEGLPIGLIGKFQSLQIRTNKAGLMSKPASIPFEDLHFMTVSLPGHAPQKTREDCGVLLRHGEDVVSLDGQTVKKAVDQHRHCNNIRCPVCFRNVIYSKAFDLSERLWAARSMLADDGYSPVLYHIILSPPPAHIDETAQLRAYTIEGFRDDRRIAAFILQECGALGGALIPHHFTEDGEDGIENAGLTGNTGNPSNWRAYSRHFHSAAFFDGFVPLEKISEVAQRYGWIAKVALPKSPNGGLPDIREGRIKTIEDLRDKAFYLYSHASVMDPDDGGRKLDAITYFGSANNKRLHEIVVSWDATDKEGKHRRVRSPQPLLQEGYVDTDDRGEKLYWYDDLQRFAPFDNVELAEKECVNAARVYCRLSQRAECEAIIDDLRRELGLGKRDQFPPAPLWARIRDDRRFFTSFVPVAELQDMRRPRKLQVDGEQLWIFEGEDLQDLAHQETEYERFCRLKDAEEAALLDSGGITHV